MKFIISRHCEAMDELQVLKIFLPWQSHELEEKAYSLIRRLPRRHESKQNNEINQAPRNDGQNEKIATSP